MKYRNQERIEREEKELEELEAEYKKTYGAPVQEEQPIADEDDVVVKENDTWKDRYSNLRSHSEKQKNDFTKQINDLKTQIEKLSKQPRQEELPVTIEDARQWTKKYPDLWGTLKVLFREEADFVTEELSAKIEKLEQTRAEVEFSKAFNMVLKAHPDFNDLVNDADFVDWVNRQPEEKGSIGELIYKSLHEELNPQNAIYSINLYKSETRKPKSTAREAVQSIGKTSATTPRIDGGKRTFTESEIDKMSSREYEKLEDEIDLAKREGRIIYDISGAAR